MKQYMESSLPLSLIEAARIDGSGEFRTFNHIVLPLMKPAIAEAIALSMADNMDAKLETLRECLEAKDTNDWLGFNRWLESNIRRTSC